jgi:hypothetical protein
LLFSNGKQNKSGGHRASSVDFRREHDTRTPGHQEFLQKAMVFPQTFPDMPSATKSALAAIKRLSVYMLATDYSVMAGTPEVSRKPPNGVEMPPHCAYEMF